jgi:hypothetical protein
VHDVQQQGKIDDLHQENSPFKEVEVLPQHQ